MKEEKTSLERIGYPLAWGIMLCVSVLPNALFHELAGGSPGWLLPAKMGLLVVLGALTWVWSPLRPLRHFIFILLAIFASEELVGRLTGSAAWRGWFNQADAPFVLEMLGVQLGRLIVALLIIAVLLGLRYRRGDFFLRMGNLKAPITPVRWLGFPRADPWNRFGGQFAVYISLGTLIFLILGGRPAPALFLQVLPVLPVILVLAAMNSFNEEMTYRASLLATTEKTLGAQQSVLLAAVFFGLGHYFGVPYGVIGVVMATFLGWLMGKAMVETRGFFWAWFIHFLQDVLIFSFMALGSITPGG